jgi:hypothetical protein
MTHVVSISDFRQDMSYYIGLVSRGDTVVLKDSKKNEEILQMTKTHKWDPVAYRAMLKNISAHPITAKDHPEWATRRKVEKWLRQTRSSWNRSIS